MSADARSTPSAPGTLRREHSSALTQVGYLAHRSITRTLRQPMMFVPSLIFPLFLLAVNSSGLSAAVHIPGFPTDSYLTFAIGLTFMQGALFATMGAGQAIASDIQHGFFNRLQLTPLRGNALIAGQLAGVAIQGLHPGHRLLLRLPGLRRPLRGRARGRARAVRAARRWSASPFGSLGLAIGLRTGNGEAVQGVFPLMFVLLFLSSGALPRDLIQTTGFRPSRRSTPSAT